MRPGRGKRGGDPRGDCRPSPRGRESHLRGLGGAGGAALGPRGAGGWSSARQPAQPSRLRVPTQPARRWWRGPWRRLRGATGVGWGRRWGVSLRVGRADGRGQVRGGGGAGEIWDQARRLEVSEGLWPGRGAGAQQASPLPTCVGPGAAQVEVQSGLQSPQAG